MGRFEQSERFFFYPEGRTYSPPIKWAVVLLKQTCALRGCGGTAKADVRSPRVASPSEPCGSCRRAVTFRAVACSSTALSTLCHSIDSVGIAHKNSQYFLLRRCRSLIFQHSFSKADWMQRHVAKETKILSGRCDLQEWQFII